MRVGIIGTGNIGGVLARLWSKAGHELLVSSRHPENLSVLGQELGIETGSPLDAAVFGDVVVLSIPLSAVVDLEDDVKAALAQKVVIETSNAYDQRDGHAYQTSEPHRNGSSGWVAEVLGHREVVKAFNTIYYVSLLEESGKGIGIPIASDSEHAVEVASKLVLDAGFVPYFVGSLPEGRYFEPGTAAYGKTVPPENLAGLIQEEVKKHK